MLLNGLAKISLSWSSGRVSRKQVSKMSTENDGKSSGITSHIPCQILREQRLTNKFTLQITLAVKTFC